MNKKSRREHSFLLILAFFSGAAGLSYEVLYTRVLSVYFGDVYFIIAAILMSTFLSLAVGYFLARILVPYLWAIEGLLGLYSLGTVYIFTNFALSPTHFFAYSNTISIFLVCLAVFIPFFLTGVSVPAFAFMLRAINKKTTDEVDKPFTIVYFIYNVGAALIVLLAEFFFIRSYGISASIIGFACINLLIAPLLLPLCRRFTPSTFQTKQDRLDSFPFILALLTIGMASTIYQLSYLEYCWRLFGPTPMVFTVVLFSALLGIVIGSIISRWFKSLHLLTSLMAIFLPLLFSFTGLLIDSWSYTANSTENATLFSFYKSSFIVLFGLPIFILFGASVPLAVRKTGKSLYGRILAIVSLGNALGALALVIFLKDALHFTGLVSVIVILLLFTTLMLSKRHLIEWKKEGFIGVASIIACIILFVLYPHKLTLLGSDTMKFPKKEREAILNDLGRVQEIREKGNLSVVLHWKDGLRGVMYLGYIPHWKIRTYNINRARAFSALSSLYSKNEDHVLMIGLANGASSSEAANRYKNVTTVEINPAMLTVIDVLRKENSDLLDKKNVEIRIQDGIVEMIRTKKKYDAIINTITQPNYYSANKLYTKEFFEIAKQKLSSGGVYVGWIPWYRGYGVNEVLTYINTLNSVFPECHYYFQTWAYYYAVCGEKLVRQEITANDQLAQWVSQLRLKSFEEDFRRFGNSNMINTLDYPVLSFKEINEPAKRSEYPQVSANWGFFKRYEYYDQDPHYPHACCQMRPPNKVCEAIFALTYLDENYCRNHLR